MVIFDFDGVLADSMKSCLAACTKAAQAQGADLDFGPNTFSTLAPLTFEALAERHALQPARFAADVAQALSASPEKPVVFDGIGEALTELAETHVLAVVSASHASVIRSVLEPSGIDHFMTRIVGGDTPGTKAEKIARLVSERPLERHVMIGDAGSDIEAARAADIGAIAVSWGWQSPAHLAAYKPDAIAETPQDLPRVCRAVLKD